MKPNRILIFNFLVLGFAGILLVCCSIKGTLKGLHSNFNQTKTVNPGLFIYPDKEVCSLLNNNEKKVYIVNGTQIKDCIMGSEKSVIYVWAPNCKSSLCLTLKTVCQKSKTLDVKLFIVAEYYDNEMMILNHDISAPLFAIDTKYYKTEMTTKYLKRFLMDIDSIKYTNRYIYFENGEYRRSFNSLDSLLVSKL